MILNVLNSILFILNNNNKMKFGTAGIRDNEEIIIKSNESPET